MMRTLIGSLLLGLAACGGMEDRAGADESTPPGRRVVSVSGDGDTAFAVHSEDPDFRRAAELARCTLPRFVERFASPPAGQTQLMLKAAFHDAAGTEYMWVDVLAVTGDTLFDGILRNDPATLTHLSWGDTVRVRAPDVADWFAVQRDTLVAGFSMRIDHRRLPAAERPAYERARGFIVDSERNALRRLAMDCRPGLADELSPVGPPLLPHGR